ncbi:MAG: vanadium-dependent haloperoxidase [Saprospiraceae bacterium]|nr:vanadium-dependent haloperoxidase [Saprospiraceae bacterium]
MKKGVLILIVLAGLLSCQRNNPNYEKEAANPEFIHRSMVRLTDVIIYDVFSPPVSSRIYAYATIAGYEALVPGYPENKSLGGQLNGLEALPKPDAGKAYCYPLASVHAFLTVGKALTFSEDSVNVFQEDLYADFEALNMPDDVYERSMQFGEAVAKHILAWSGKDNYKQTRTFPKFSLNDEPARWQPTPPGYKEAVEPHWNKIRPFTLDSASQFAPAPPTAFSTDKSSLFYKEAMEVYKALDAADKEERIAIARFWDDNPFISHHVGHVMFATKKASPGGHWTGIGAIAARTANADLMKTTETYLYITLAMADGFISCWDEKYRSNLVRPETYINKYIDENWAPLLQTPPFPEYTSGHSVISSAIATVMTHLYGDQFEYTDTTEEIIGLPARRFKSFVAASKEACISRLYGGIHYMPAIVNGATQGGNVGAHLLERVKTR